MYELSGDDLGNIEYHIDQGKTFNGYVKKYETISNNAHPYLNLSSEYSSIVEALNGEDSIKKMTDDIKANISKYETEYNQILSEYSTKYKLFTTSVLSVSSTKKLSNSEILTNDAIVADLRNKNARLLTLAGLIIADLDKLKLNTTNTSITEKYQSLIYSINQLRIEREKMNNVQYDEDSILGSLETTELTYKSNYAHYLVFFIVAMTLVGYIFFIYFNPEMNILELLYVVGGLLIVYVLSLIFSGNQSSVASVSGSGSSSDSGSQKCPFN
jgi:hypothetical protein